MWCRRGARPAKEWTRPGPGPCAMWWSQRMDTDGNPWKTWGMQQAANGHPPVPACEYASPVESSTCLPQILKGAINWENEAGVPLPTMGEGIQLLIFLLRGKRFQYQHFTPCLLPLSIVRILSPCILIVKCNVLNMKQTHLCVTEIFPKSLNCSKRLLF